MQIYDFFSNPLEEGGTGNTLVPNPRRRRNLREQRDVNDYLHGAEAPESVRRLVIVDHKVVKGECGWQERVKDTQVSSAAFCRLLLH